MKFSILLASLFATSYVSAHGTISSTENARGEKFTINRDPKSPNQTPIRRPSDLGAAQNPISDFSSPSLTCGTGAQLSKLNLDVNPGETVSVEWRAADNSEWFHNTGPLITYLADCGESCANFQHNEKTKFFKIHEVGENPAQPGTWFQAVLKAGGVYTFTVPAKLAPGNYLARSEIIALHLAPKTIEFYPGCIQLKVNGDERGQFDPSKAVNFPGHYKESEKGFKTSDLPNYIIPGGPIAQILEDGSPQEEPSSSESPSLSDPPSNLTSTSRPSSTSSRRPSSTSSRRPPATPKPSLSMSTGPPDDVGVDSSPTSLPRSSGSDPTNLPASNPTPTTTTDDDGYNRRQLGHIMRRRTQI